MINRNVISKCEGTDCTLGPACSIWLVDHASGVRTRWSSRTWALLAAHASWLDSPDEWVVINGMGGMVCSTCQEPTESEPCKDHQPSASHE